MTTARGLASLLYRQGYCRLSFSILVCCDACIKAGSMCESNICNPLMLKIWAQWQDAVCQETCVVCAGCKSCKGRAYLGIAGQRQQTFTTISLLSLSLHTSDGRHGT